MLQAVGEPIMIRRGHRSAAKLVEQAPRLTDRARQEISSALNREHARPADIEVRFYQAVGSLTEIMQCLSLLGQRLLTDQETAIVINDARCRATRWRLGKIEEGTATTKWSDDIPVRRRVSSFATLFLHLRQHDLMNPKPLTRYLFPTGNSSENWECESVPQADLQKFIHTYPVIIAAAIEKTRPYMRSTVPGRTHMRRAICDVQLVFRTIGPITFVPSPHKPTPRAKAKPSTSTAKRPMQYSLALS